MASLSVSPEDLKLFHTIDRGIFARLVLNLRRGIAESINVVAFLLWLEHGKYARNVLYKIQTWSDPLINALADETVKCLACVESVEFPFNSFEDSNYLIPLIRKVTDNEVSLRFIHDNRLHVIRGIVKLAQDVCFRVFDDIMKQVLMVNLMEAEEASFEENLESLRRFYGPLIRPILPAFDNSSRVLPNVGDESKGHQANQQVIRPYPSSSFSDFCHEFGDIGDQSKGNDQANQQVISPNPDSGYSSFFDRFGYVGDQRMGHHQANQQVIRSNSNPSDSGFFNMATQQAVEPKSKSDDSGFLHGSNLGAHIKSPKDDLEEMISTINSICSGLLDEDNNDKKIKEVTAEDRTIFLTFSKGYPISKTEVIDFFTRKFGVDFIDGIEMQEVPDGEQPLYARLILRFASDFEIILNGLPKAKYSINGKHVWARKFQRRHPAMQVAASNEPSSLP